MLFTLPSTFFLKIPHDAQINNGSNVVIIARTNRLKGWIKNLTCFLASIGPSQTPMTILSLANSAAAYHVRQEVRNYIFVVLPVPRTRLDVIRKKKRKKEQDSM
jgi:hypothetical protein